MKICGIYQILNLINDQRYIGQSVDVKSRWSCHRYQLNKGVHANMHLQNAWNKYNKDSFVFEVLLTCDSKSLYIMEEQYANKYKQNLYNINKDYTSMHGCNNPFFGKNHSEKSKQKMSDWKKTNFLGENNPNYGKNILKKLV